MMPNGPSSMTWSGAMSKPDLDHTIARWTRLGVLFGGRPTRTSPDLEPLLLDTARLAPISARLFYLAVSWLSQYGNFVARHRLKRLIETHLARPNESALAAMLHLAVNHGASKELRIAAEACHPAEELCPLFAVHRRSPARANACSSGGMVSSRLRLMAMRRTPRHRPPWPSAADSR